MTVVGCLFIELPPTKRTVPHVDAMRTGVLAIPGDREERLIYRSERSFRNARTDDGFRPER